MPGIRQLLIAFPYARFREILFPFLRDCFQKGMQEKGSN